jgi:hypothetical protein
MLAIIRILWAAPLTVGGLLLAFMLYALSGFRGQWRWRSPAISFINPLTQKIFAHRALRLNALCIGQVILARDQACLQSAWSHECVHIRQSLRWGPLFPLLYLSHSLWCALTGRHAYWDNVFEVQAREAEHGAD